MEYELDNFFNDAFNIGSIRRSMGRSMFGINHRRIPTAAQMNKDDYGLVFMTRPQLNLSSNNIRNHRKLYPLLTTNPHSIQRYIRTILDPRLMQSNLYPLNPEYGMLSPFTDNNNAFIPLVTNNAVTSSGWPDLVVPIYTSDQGKKKEQYAQVDGVLDHYQSLDIDISFRNTLGDPLLSMFYYWALYSTLVFDGTLEPYMDFIKENEMDYNTRIYRIILDPQKKIIRKIASTGITIVPGNSPMGQFFDFAIDKPYNLQSKEFTIRFPSLGIIENDYILVKSFNRTVEIFNPDMELDPITYNLIESDKMTKLPLAALTYFNLNKYPQYPHINPDTFELEWYVRSEDYTTYKNKFGIPS